MTITEQARQTIYARSTIASCMRITCYFLLSDHGWFDEDRASDFLGLSLISSVSTSFLINEVKHPSRRRKIGKAIQLEG